MKPFVHLHVHSEYSLADSTLKIIDMVAKAKEFNMDSLALTDHGAMFGVIYFYEACKEAGIKPIIGMETYVAPRSNTQKENGIDDANYHLVLLCENNIGYQNLMYIASNAAIQGFYKKPRTDKSILYQYHEGLIALSACIGGEVQDLILKGDYEGAKKAALEYDAIFGRGNFYLELQDHKMPEQAIVNTQLIKLSRETGIPLVVTNDCHYLTRDNAYAHDVLMAIQAKTTIYDENRKKYPSNEFYFKSQEEMWELFGYIPEALENTVKIAERCNVEIEFGKNKIPEFHVPKNYHGTEYDFLRELTYNGAKQKYKELTPEIIERIEYELSVIQKMGYVNYFLIVWDFFRFCKTGAVDIDDPSPENWQPILTGAGRGSGAGSIILYCLDVTKVDPLKYDLLFERFLDPSRISMPDVDSDFQYDRRHEVIEYIIKKYGRNSVSQIITFGTMAARASIRAVGRALDLPYSLQDTIAKMIPMEQGITIPDALEINPDLKMKYLTDPVVKKLIDIAIQLEGLPLYTGTHAGGVLITDKKGINYYVPLWNNDGAIVSQYDMGVLEKLGLLKMDLLGLRTLTVINDTLNFIKKNHNVELKVEDIYKLIDTDLKPLELIANGYTEGIFQLESPGMTSFMKELKPKNIEEVIAGISLYRPGPLQYIPKFLEYRRNPQNIQYEFEELRPILQNTYGVITYQEQCMKIVMALAGYQKHHSDSFRKAIAKKKQDLIQQHRTWFIDGRPEIKDENGNIIQDAIPGGVTLGHPREKLEKLYNEMEEFGKYAFNKSHAASYAYIAYVTAYLKYYYPTEFMAALLTSVINDKKKVARYINHCKQDLNIAVVTPDINLGNIAFIPLPNRKIIFSLLAKNVSSEVLKLILAERENGYFSDMQNFLERCLHLLDRQSFESLIYIGAFDSLNVIRSQFIAAMDDLMNIRNKIKNYLKRQNNQSLKKRISISDYLQLDNILPNINEFPEEIKCKLEKDYAGLFLSGNPLYKYANIIKNKTNFKTSDLEYEINEETGEVMLFSNIQNNKNVTLVALIEDLKITTTKNKERMAIADIVDLYGSARLIIFPKTYDEYKNVLNVNKIYLINARVSIKSNEAPNLICIDLQPIEYSLIKRCIIHANTIDECKQVLNLIKNNSFLKGNNPLYIRLPKFNILTNKNFWVNADEAFKYIPNIIIQEW